MHLVSRSIVVKVRTSNKIVAKAICDAMMEEGHTDAGTRYIYDNSRVVALKNSVLQTDSNVVTTILQGPEANPCAQFVLSVRGIPREHSRSSARKATRALEAAYGCACCVVGREDTIGCLLTLLAGFITDEKTPNNFVKKQLFRAQHVPIHL